jgi:hypothetical protein
MLRLPRFDGHGFGALREYDTSGFTQAAFARRVGGVSDFRELEGEVGRALARERRRAS